MYVHVCIVVRKYQVCTTFFLITDLSSVILFCGILFIPISLVNLLSLNLKPTICKTSALYYHINNCRCN